MPYIVGITLALLLCAAAAAIGIDRDRAFYPSVLIAVASYYVAFAVGDGRGEIMLVEASIAAAFVVAAAVSFRNSPWIAVVGLGAHGLMDAFHHLLVDNAGVPEAWPGFCMAFDLVAAAVVAWLMLRRARIVKASATPVF